MARIQTNQPATQNRHAQEKIILKKVIVASAIMFSFALGLSLNLSGLVDVPATSEAANGKPNIVWSNFDKAPSTTSWSYVGFIQLDRSFHHVSHNSANNKVILYFSK